MRALAAIVAALGLGLGLAAPALLGPDAGAAGGDAGTFTATQTVSHDEVVNGTDQVVDTRTVTLDVSQTANLQGRQEIQVSWSGARPTGGIVADQNSAQAQYEEYPFVLLECRGIDSTGVSPAQQLTPETCWTQTWSEHYQDSLGDAYPPYRLDEYASAAQRAPIVGAPSPFPRRAMATRTRRCRTGFPSMPTTGRSTTAATPAVPASPPSPTTWVAPRSPSNETFGVTGLDGTGSADFDVFTSDQNASLGCSQTVPCALVAVPIMGISCDPTSASPAPSQTDVAQCEDTGAYAPGPRRTAAPTRTVPTWPSPAASGGARRTGATGSPCP